MRKDKLITVIANTGIKQVLRKYPYIVSGEIVGTFDVNYTHLHNPDKLPVTGVRILFWVDPEIFYSIFPKNSLLYNQIINKELKLTTRYLSSFYEKDSEGYKELYSLDDEIMDIFYRTSSILNATKKAGMIDFFTRFAFLGSDISDDFIGFTDWDTAYPPREFYLANP